MKKISKMMVFILAFFMHTSLFAAEGKPLVFATEATYPPFETINSQGQMQGFDVDMITAICVKIHRACTFVNQPWDSLIPGLTLGKFDVIFGAMAITAERQKHVAFTEPYHFSTASFIAPVVSHITLTPEGLKHKVIGVQGGTTMDNYAQDTYGKIPTVTIARYGSLQDALLDLHSGRIDIVFADTDLLQHWLKTPQNTGFEIIGKPVGDPKFFGTGYGFAVKKENTVLLEQLNEGLKAIRADGTYQKITKKYF